MYALIEIIAEFRMKGTPKIRCSDLMQRFHLFLLSALAYMYSQFAIRIYQITPHAERLLLLPLILDMWLLTE